MTSHRRGRGGGAATAAGTDFQARLAAWFACAILAERDAAPLWDWAETEAFETVYAETGEAVDDLYVTNSAGCRAYIQAKFRVQLSEREDSQLASALGQFVRQYLDLDRSPRACDRFVLATSSESSSRIREQLPRILTRARGLRAGESLTGAARGAQEQEVLRIVTAHLAKAWDAVTGSKPTDEDLRGVLRATRVSIHDLYEDGSGVREAVGWLRTSILRYQGTAGGVWRQLISLTAEFSVLQTGADRRWLQHRLTELGVELRAAPSFRRDIEKLLAHSRQTVERLADFSVIRGDDGEPIKLQRDTPAELRRTLENGSVIVTGDPGAGKSASLFELAQLVRDDDVVVLASDTLAAGSLGQLRDELRLEHEVIDVLQNWPGVRPAYLIIDALDAARGERTQEALLDLIGSAARSAERWVIAASIRRFDLRYNQDLHALFATGAPSAPADFQTTEFAALRHFNVPLLSEQELAQLEELAPRLHAVIARATHELKELIRSPFNLRLLAELVSLNVDAAELEPITTQLQLLDKYWQHRVLSADSGGDALETVLRVACEAMIDTRSMRVDRATLQRDPTYAAPIRELLSNRVLTEEERGGSVEREVIAFSHHVLFDYAVARLLFRGVEEMIVRRTAEQPELLLVVRPSYELHFRYLWESAADRHAFWSLAIALASADELPQIGKIVGPGVAARQISRPADVDALLDAFEAGERRAAAELVLRHVVGARLAEGSFSEAIPTNRRAVWCDVAHALSGTLRSETAYPTRNLLMELCAKPDLFDDEQLASAGSAARNLLRWARDSRTRDRHMLGIAIEAVARTFASDPAASEELLRGVLSTERLREYGFVEMPQLADEVPGLIDKSSGLVRDIYAVGFEFVEDSEERTQISSGVVGLTSHRRQDYQMAHYSLAKAFPDFMRKAPDEAIDALAAIRRSYGRRRAAAERAAAPIELDWEGESVFIEPDGSYVWDSNRLDHHEEVKVLNEFERWVAERVEAEGDAAAARIVGSVRRASRPASLWRRILVVAERSPEAFAAVLQPLISRTGALASVDLSSLIGDFLKKVFPLLSEDSRRRIEEAILTLPDALAPPTDGGEAAGRRHSEHVRDRLLGCLSEEALTTDPARARLAELGAADAVPENRPHVGPIEWSSGEWTEKDELAERGVDVDAPANRRLQELQDPVNTFATRFMNDSPGLAAIADIEQPLSELWAALQTADQDGVSPEQADYGWGDASAAAEAIVRGDGITTDASAFQLAREILLQAARHQVPEPRDEDSQFDDAPSWGTHSPRVEAASGLLSIAFHEEPVSEKVLSLLDDLAMDPAPEVRLHVARRLVLLRRGAPAAMWRIAYRIMHDDASTVVLDSLVKSLARMVSAEETDRLEEAVRALFERGKPERPGAKDLRQGCVHAMTDLYIWDGHEGAGEFLRDVVIGAIESEPDDAAAIVHRLREPLTHGDSSGDLGHTAIRRRTVEIAKLLLETAIAANNAQTEEPRREEQLPDDHPLVVRARAIAHIIDGISSEIYFASGAFDEKQPREPSTEGAKRERFYGEVGPVLDLLSEVPFPTVTHHVLETLEVCIPLDPRGVFLRIARAIKAGQGGSYETDSLGATLVVKLIERYLAEHRTLLQEDEECRTALVEILDIFVSAGWPEARRLTYGLQDIFR